MVMVSGCGCPELMTGPVQDPRVYNATLTEFNAGWNPPTNPADPNDRGTPVPLFSISTFEFPANVSSSGSLPNDNRFSNGSGVVLANAGPWTVDSNTYRAALVLRAPSNDLLVGDIMVVSVDLSSMTAVLRFYGSLTAMPGPLSSASATDLVDYIRTNAHTEAQLTDLRARSKLYGGGAPTMLGADTVVVDQLGRVVSGVAIPASVRAQLATSTVTTVRDVTVHIGDVFYYVARNGFEFAVHIEDIARVGLPPNPQIVRISFAALHGPASCTPM